MEVVFRRTLSSIPTEVPDAIEGVESKRGGQNDLGRIFERFGKTGNDFQYVC